ncbi:MAG: glycosyltransferase family 4 protein [Gammaproteobacteria bacterium]
MTGRKRTVLAVVANVKQFRRAFYPHLAEALARHDVILRVAYSDPHHLEASKNDSTDLAPPIGIKCRRLYFLGGRVLAQWLPLSEIVEADLVIIVQSNGYLANYPLLVANRLGLKKVAFWGHGYNHQATSKGMRESFRRFLLRFCHWWFAYTDRTAKHLVAAGMPADRITVVNNAVDTRAFAGQVAGVAAEQKSALRAELGIAEGAPVALYCGSLYAHKHIDFLLDAGRRIREQRPDFTLLIVGAGPDAPAVEKVAREHAWLRYLGSQFGERKARLFAVADVFLNPGLVGLAILDSFAAALPFITTDIPIHSPEVAYLEPGVSGLIVAHDAASYAREVAELLADPARLREMKRAALDTSRRFTVENMVRNVEGGIVASLGAPRWP